MDGGPPEQALNAYGVGIAFIVSVPDGMDVPEDGKLDRAQADEILDANPFISDRKAIIFRSDSSAGPGWSESFDPGYSCGQCIEALEGETFDSYEPTSCEDVELRPESESDVCNWT